MTQDTDKGGTLSERFQFQVDGRGFGARVHTEWHLAARDAVAAGYGHWNGPEEVLLYDGASIARF